MSEVKSRSTMEMNGEEFRTISDFPDYEISNFGRVRSNRINRPRMMKPIVTDSGYLYAGLLSPEGKYCNKRIHVLLVNAFILDGYVDKGYVADHINNIKTDNRLENLQVISKRENNSKDKLGGTSEYIGVSWNKILKKWQVSISINSKQIGLGIYRNEKVAAALYQHALEQIEKQQPIIIGSRTIETRRDSKRELQFIQQQWLRAQKSQAKISLPTDQMKRLEAHSKSTGLSKSVLLHLLLNANKSYNTVMSKHLNK